MDKTKWPTRCKCAAGSEETGWHEVRCAECRAVELAQWRAAISRHEQWIRAFRKDASR